MVENSKRVYVKSFGCSANLAEGEVISGCLSEAGFKVVKNPKEADFLVYNTCAVKAQTENRVMDILRKVSKDKHLVVSGCLPMINFERLKREVSFGGVTGPAPGLGIVDVVFRVGNGEHVICLDGVSKSGLALPRVPLNPVVSVIPINYGCLGNCAYCCVHFARGPLRSNSIIEVVERVHRDVGYGVKEFWLTSQDTACYGKDIGTTLPELLQQVCKIEGRFFVRLGMMNPDHVLGILDELVEAYADRKVFKFLHLPIQSGDDRILKLMNRRYSVEDFKRIVFVFRKKFPRLTLSTDVICGFPGESKQSFENTLKLISDVQPDVVNVSKFFARPKTAAESLEPIASRELNRRSRVLSGLSRRVSLEKNKSWLDWHGNVLFDERGKEGSFMGRNFAYKPIVVKSREFLIDKFLEVRIVGAFSTYLEAELV
jgi:threonylcarbamoyladenosine tRNA methylthiotransferase CDKAL1